MKNIFAPALALGLALAAGDAGPAHAAASSAVVATGIVETPNAVFFQPASSPNVVWYFTKSEVKVTPVDPVGPVYTYWRAAVVLKSVSADDLAALPAEWAHKTLVPYIVRPTTECSLTRLDEMKFVFQDIKAQNHDVTPANPTGVCRFSYRLPTQQPPDLQARLAQLIASDTLVKRDLQVDVRTQATVPWAEVYGAVNVALNPPPPPPPTHSSVTTPPPPPPPGLTLAEARTAVEAALASPALAQVAAAVSADEKEAFIESALLGCFVDEEDGVHVHLAATAPAGSLVYHQEIFSRAM